MGYYTYYNLLDTRPEIESVPGLSEKVEQLAGGGVMEGDGSTEERATWYEHEEDMESLSEESPTVLFILEGEGENNGDAWIKYFQYGKLQATARAQFVYPKVDTTKFKP